jgi:Bax protein
MIKIIVKLSTLFLIALSFSSHASFTIKLPSQSKYESVEEYKRVFIDVINAAIKKSNSDLEIKRSKVLRLISTFNERGSLSVEEDRFMKRLLTKYKLKEINKLPVHINKIPAGILVAFSIYESKWGRIDNLVRSNNPFGVLCFKKGCGLKYSKSKDSGVYSELEVYNSIDNAIREFIFALNKEKEFKGFRDYRTSVYFQGKEMESLRTAEYFVNYNGSTDFDQKLRDIVFNNNLHYLD